MNWTSLRAWLGTVIRLGLGALWLWAGIEKVGNPRHFVQVVRAYDATPEWLSKAIGYGLPVLEIGLGGLLVLGIAVRLSAAVSGVLYLVFAIGIIQAWARDLKLECGCFGGGGETVGATHYWLDILRDVGLLAAAVYLVVWSMTRLSVESYVARHDEVELPSAKRMRSPDAMKKYNAAIESKRKAARDRALYVNSSLSVIVVLVCVIAIGVQANRAKIDGAQTSLNADAKNGVVWGAVAAATVDVYEDFQCPHCLEFETETHVVLEADVRANRAQVRYHPMSFLDSASNGNKYSSRAANAALCASDVSTDVFVAFHDQLFNAAFQPKEGSNGRTDAEFVTVAQKAGMTAEQVTSFTTCVQTDQHKDLVEAITEQASKRGITSTPTVLVNGKQVDPNLTALAAAILTASHSGPAPTPSPTPSPTPTTTATASPTKSPTPSGSTTK